MTIKIIKIEETYYSVYSDRYSTHVVGKIEWNVYKACWEFVVTSAFEGFTKQELDTINTPLQYLPDLEIPKKNTVDNYM